MGQSISYAHYARQYIQSYVSRSKEQHMAEVEKSVAKLRSTQEFIQSKIETKEQQVAVFQRKAAICLKEKKRNEALSQLRLKKMYEQEICKLNSIAFSLQTHILHLDSVLVMIETVDTLKSTAFDMQRANHSVDIDKLDDALENIMENQDHHTSLETILSSYPTTQMQEFDEDDLLSELESVDFEAEVNDFKNDQSVNLPSLPPSLKQTTKSHKKPTVQVVSVPTTSKELVTLEMEC